MTISTVQYDRGQVGGSTKRHRVLPADIALDASRRLGIAGLAMGFVLLLLMVERFTGYRTSVAWFVLDAVTTLLSFVLYFLCRSGGISPHRLMDVALAYEFMLCFTLSYMDFSVPGGAERLREGGISWACVVIVLFPALIPATPTRTIAASTVAASMGPLAYAMALGMHEDPHVMKPFDLFMLFVDNYIAAGLALVPSLVFTKLATDIASAREVGSYTLEERLGVGGMGEVWKAKHRLLARPSAVKLIRSESMGGTLAAGNVLQRFEREARATAALRSPHTVVLYDFGLSEEGTFYYVMELLDGFDLEVLVERVGPIPPNRTVYLLMQACASLYEAHQAGLVHRDIKPANIYVCRLGCEYDFLKLLDFGLVKTMSDDGPEAAKLSMANMVYGTPAYMAPEQARGDEVSARTDIYALGCVAYYMLTGQLVFDSRSTGQILIDHVQTTPAPPSQRTSRDIPSDLEKIVLQCLEKDPARRPASARDLAQALARCEVGPPWTAADAEAWWCENMQRLARPKEDAGGGILTSPMAADSGRPRA